MPLNFIFTDGRVNNVAMWQNTTGKRLYLNHDQTQVVMEDTPEAGFVLVGPEGSIPMEDAVRYGLVAADDVPLAKHPDMPEATAQPNEEVATALKDADKTSASTEEKASAADAEQETAAKAQSPASDKSVKPASSAVSNKDK